MTSIIAAYCCCQDDCTKKGLVRICWSNQSVYRNHSILYSTQEECIDCVTPGAPTGPTSCPAEDLCDMPEFGECECYKFVDLFGPFDCIQQWNFRCQSSFNSGSWCLDFTYKTTNSAVNQPAINWVYYDGTTFTTTNLSYTFDRLIDVYDDNVVVAYEYTGGPGTNCCQGVDAAIGTVLGTGDFDVTQSVLVRYHRRGTYAVPPSPFTIKRQTGGSNARFYAIEDVAGVKSFVIKNAVGATVHTVNMTTNTLEQLRANLDAHATNPMICVSAMNVTTGALASTLLPYRGNTAIPSSTSTAVGVWAVVTGTKTEYYQADTVAPFWVSPFSASLKNDANPNLAFSAGYDDAAEAMFCVGYCGQVDDLDCNITFSGYPGAAGCIPPTVGSDCGTLITCIGAAAIMPWGQRPGPIGSPGIVTVTSDDTCDTFCQQSVDRYACDAGFWDCLSEECDIAGLCQYFSLYTAWKATGSYSLQRIV